jgi:hypothetical protein
VAQLRAATLRDVRRVERGIELLKEARDLFADAGCPRTVSRVRATLRSAGGALRHVDRRHAFAAEERDRQLEA